ncbi:uncharacterized protein LOC134601729 [Pelobates fuscus]|uniref:uncharacterized protein LOC134601729 n=1 Tax=Pelobates fuscus TaxID=191477 RepID=UPI002FE44812
MALPHYMGHTALVLALMLIWKLQAEGVKHDKGVCSATNNNLEFKSEQFQGGRYRRIACSKGQKRIAGKSNLIDCNKHLIHELQIDTICKTTKQIQTTPLPPRSVVPSTQSSSTLGPYTHTMASSSASRADSSTASAAKTIQTELTQKVTTMSSAAEKTQPFSIGTSQTKTSTNPTPTITDDAMNMTLDNATTVQTSDIIDYYNNVISGVGSGFGIIIIILVSLCIVVIIRRRNRNRQTYTEGNDVELTTFMSTEQGAPRREE